MMVTQETSVLTSFLIYEKLSGPIKSGVLETGPEPDGDDQDE